MESPRLPRAYVDAAFAALAATGHRATTDTVLIGELAPEGGAGYAPDQDPIPPLPFLRALYCVDGSYRPLSGAPATALGCPAGGSRAAFVSAHPSLFGATGFAHHPYSFFLAPNVPMANPSFVPLFELPRLEHALDRVFATYAVLCALPLCLTEYRYETNPPNPSRGVPPDTQVQYLDEAQYMAWKDPRVRTLSQFLLYDSAPDPAYPPGTPGYWSTFQTGLLCANAVTKPAFGARRGPIYLPDPVVASGRAPSAARAGAPQRPHLRDWSQSRNSNHVPETL